MFQERRTATEGTEEAGIAENDGLARTLALPFWGTAQKLALRAATGGGKEEGRMQKAEWIQLPQLRLV